MADHAILSASGSDTWAYCPGSVRACADLPNETSEFAELGTLKHATGEALARVELLGESVDVPNPELIDDVRPYVDLIAGLFNPAEDTLLLEQRLRFDEWVEDGFGTADCVLIKPDGRAYIIDLKSGQGVKVFVGAQLKIYALAMLQKFQFSHGIERVTMIISQPALDHQDELEMTVDELLEFGAWLKDRAELTKLPDAPFVPSVKSCRWCKARFTCRARALDALNVAGSEHLTPADIAMLLPQVDQVKSWVRDLEAHAFELLAEGTDVPGYKLVEGRSVRKWADDAAETLLDSGLSEDQIYRKSLTTLGEVEKALGGKKKAAPVLDRCTVKPEGKPSIAKTSDPRPAIAVFTVDQFPTGE